MPLLPIRYTLSFAARATHYVDVEAVLPAAGPVELMMAIWTPGSYMLREYARHVEALEAAGAGGKALPVSKTSKNRWRIDAGPGEVTVRYRVYAREMTVRTSWVEADFALLNGASIFLTEAGATARPHDVRIVLPQGWRECVTALPAHPDGKPCHFRAPDFDTLVDSPLLLGNPALYPFEVQGKPHLLANEGESGLWDGPRAALDVQKIVAEATALWGAIPYERYVFLNLLTEGKGGLEHQASTVMMASRYAARTRKEYLEWLGLVAHEFFHTWNVKRLRPAALGPFDYEREAYTPSLWQVEGFTAYYDDLLVHRAGLSLRAEYLEVLSKTIESLQTTPGRLVQSVERASLDAWIKQYRPDENSINTAISYYVKGAVLAFLLDARLRRLTGGQKSLDDVLRAAYARFSGEQGFRQDELLALMDQIAPVSEWLVPLLTTTRELDYSEALAWLGLRFAEPTTAKKDDAEPVKGYLGINTKSDGGRLVVTQVLRDTPAYAAGLNVDDEIVAIDELRVTPESWDDRLKVYPPGSAVELLVARRQRLTRLPLTLSQKPPERWRLEEDPGASAEAKTQRDAWLASVRRA